MNTYIESGKVLIISSGAYSDYEVDFVAKTMKEIVIADVERAYKSEFPDNVGNYKFESSHFYSWLIDNGYITELDFAELHTDDYNDMQLDILRGGEACTT